MTAKTEVIAVAQLVASDGVVAPGGTGEFDVETAKSLVDRGLAAWPKSKAVAEAPVSPPPPPARRSPPPPPQDVDGDGDVDSRDEVVAAVAEAIRGLGTPESNPDAFTAAGDPKLDVLSEAVGYRVGATVRADAMALLAAPDAGDGEGDDESAETEGGDGDAGDGDA